MVGPLLAAIPLAGLLTGHAARIGITRFAATTQARAMTSTFAQSLPFGVGYSFGTYLGFPGNYRQNSATLSTGSRQVSLSKVPYRRRASYSSSRYSRYPRSSYSRYPRRRYRRYPRRYSRYY